MPAVHLVISGRVQGVGFRIFVERQALKRGVRGWVRNRRDGTVEALIIGDERALGEMEAACRRGPSLAVVTQLDRFDAADDGSDGFEARPTA
ncbi:MAG TPA: acylphosphatase [Stellaceae bacterium]|nr:acylphosphatase [Stellaceae bacterium]